MKLGGFVTDVIVATYGGQVDARSRESLLALEAIVADELQRSQGNPSQLRIADLLPYLKAYQFSRQYPWLPPLALGLFVVGVGATAYYVGKKR